MKKLVLLVVAAVVAAAGMFSGCSKDMGNIIRTDIVFDDINFVLKDSELNPDITEDDMVNAMGWPYARNWAMQGYEYVYYSEDEKWGQGVIKFFFTTNGYFYGVDYETEGEKPKLEDLPLGTGKADLSKSMRPIRKDIRESDLEFIDEPVTAVEVQELLGAPHGAVNPEDMELKTVVYYYPFKERGLFFISYERGGVIVKAWTIDEKGEDLRVFVDRTDIFGLIDYYQDTVDID